MDLKKHGLHFRGLREFDRQNYGKAYEAFKAAGNYRDSLFKMAEIVRQTSQPMSEIAAHYWAAYDAGDKAALPWLCTIEEGEAFETKVEHPRLKEIAADLASLIESHNPDVIREHARLSFQVGELSEGLRYLKAGVLLGDPESRILLSDLLIFGPSSPGLIDCYTLLLDKNNFDFENFPFSPKLNPLTNPGETNSEEDLKMSEEMSKLLFWLYDQGDTDLRTPGLLMRRIQQEMTTAEGFDFFVDYHREMKNSFGYQGALFVDITTIFDLAAHLLRVTKKPDLTVYEYLSNKFGVRDLFDEMVEEIMLSEAKIIHDRTFYNVFTYSYSSDFSIEAARSRIPIDFQLPSVKSFIDCVESLDFNSAEELFDNLLKDAGSEVEGACLELANLLEFVDRSRFEFDYLPKRIVSFAFDSVLSAIQEKGNEALRKTLVEFSPNGERPYFMDEFDFESLGMQG